MPLQQQHLLEGKPIFCFETAIKLLYWCGFVYEHDEVCICCIAVRPLLHCQSMNSSCPELSGFVDCKPVKDSCPELSDFVAQQKTYRPCCLVL